MLQRWKLPALDGPRLPKVSESQSGKAILLFGTVRKESTAKAAQELYGRVAQRKGHPGGCRREGLGGAQCQFSF